MENRIHRTIRSGLIYGAIMLGVLSCGKGMNMNPEGEDGVRVRGQTAYRSQCPLLGTVSDLRPLRLELWDCPLSMDEVQLARPPVPLIFEANCQEKSLTIRSEDRSIDTRWHVMPNGVFEIEFDGGPVGLANDGAGSCWTTSKADIRGRMNCSDEEPDKANIEIEALWWLGQTSATGSTTLNGANRPSGRQCTLPANRGCYLYTAQIIRQCQ